MLHFPSEGNPALLAGIAINYIFLCFPSPSFSFKSTVLIPSYRQAQVRLSEGNSKWHILPFLALLCFKNLVCDWLLVRELEEKRSSHLSLLLGLQPNWVYKTLNTFIYTFVSRGPRLWKSGLNQLRGKFLCTVYLRMPFGSFSLLSWLSCVLLRKWCTSNLWVMLNNFVAPFTFHFSSRVIFANNNFSELLAEEAEETVGDSTRKKGTASLPFFFLHPIIASSPGPVYS